MIDDDEIKEDDTVKNIVYKEIFWGMKTLLSILLYADNFRK
jgi:hypothetical protein